MSRKVKEVIRAAGRRDELALTSFRHGGFTEAGDAELTDRELMAQRRGGASLPRCSANMSSGPCGRSLRASEAPCSANGQGAVVGMSNSLLVGMRRAGVGNGAKPEAIRASARI